MRKISIAIVEEENGLSISDTHSCPDCGRASDDLFQLRS